MLFKKVNVGPFLSKGEGYFPQDFKISKPPAFKLTYPTHKPKRSNAFFNLKTWRSLPLPLTL